MLYPKHWIIKKTVLFILILSYTPIGLAQNIMMQGLIKNQSGEALLGVNMLAKPLVEGNKTAFAFTDYNGFYKIQLKKDIPYSLSITYVGYATITDSIQLGENTNREYVLQEAIGQLDEVVLKAKMAMLVKKDTTIYRPEFFVTGNERKLRDILDKLPGVEVDKDGNVTVQGKEVTDLTVDGKPFFGGDTKLGVTNIPAEVVEEIEVIDDYHEVSFKKGLEPSQRMAMNIKLKEGKKEFVFGDTAAGGGKSEKYYLQPSLFYYSPKTALNFIGSLNNVNKSPMRRSDVSRFRRGALTYSSNTPIDDMDRALSQFSLTSNVLHNKTAFGAINASHQLSKSLYIDAYAIHNYQNSRALTTSEIDYLLQDNLHESTVNHRKVKERNSLGNIKLAYKPNTSTDVAYTMHISYMDVTRKQNIDSKYDLEEKHVQSLQTIDNIEFAHALRWSFQRQYKHTSEIHINHTYKKRTNPTNWTLDKPLFHNLIPFIEEEGTYRFLQNLSSNSQVGSAEFKHFWVLNPTNHIYPFTGLHFIDQSYTSTDYQLLQDGSTNSFDKANFNNATGFRLFNPYIGLQYKIMLGNMFVRPGFIYNHYYWRISQFESKILDKNKGILLPELNIDYKIKRDLTLQLDYALKSYFKEASVYANRYRLQAYNLIYKGNENLENERYHKTTLSLRYISMLNTLANLQLSYYKREKSVRHTTIFDGIEQVSSSIYSNLPENSYNILASYYKTWLRTFSLGTSIHTNFNDYSRIVNSEKIDYKNNSIGYSLQATINKKELPYLRLVWSQRFSNSGSKSYKSRFISLGPSLDFEYNFLKNFVAKADYTYTYSKHKSTNQKETFELANASLEYRKANSLFSFELQIENVFDLKYKRLYRLDQLTLYDQYQYIQPRTVLFLVSLKL